MLIIPMAGRGHRFSDEGYTTYKPFLPLKGRTIIENVIDNLGGNALLIAQEEHAKEASNYGEVITVPGLTEGAACTVLAAEDKITDEELIIGNCDQLVDVDINDFLGEAREYDACIMTFHSDHPKWSYAKLADGLVTEVAEKKVISEHATVGIYYYKRGTDFVKAAKRMIEDNFRVNNEYYVCPVFNWYPRDKKIGVYKIGKEQMHGLGLPEDYEAYLKLIGE